MAATFAGMIKGSTPTPAPLIAATTPSDSIPSSHHQQHSSRVTTATTTSTRSIANDVVQFGIFSFKEVARVVGPLRKELKLPWVSSLPSRGQFRRWTGPVKESVESSIKNKHTKTTTTVEDNTTTAIVTATPPSAPMTWAQLTKQNIKPTQSTTATTATTATLTNSNKIPSNTTIANQSNGTVKPVMTNGASSNRLDKKSNTSTSMVHPINGNIKPFISLAHVMQDYSLSFHVPLIQPRGMLNNSNTCYMNAILQPLAHCPPFYNLFNTIGQRVAFSFNSETPLVESMVMFVKEFQELAASKELDPFTPAYVYETLRKLNKFDSLRGRQEDADEFLGSLLDTLHEEFDQARRKHKEALEKQQKNSKLEGTDEMTHTNNSNGDTWLEVGKKQKTCQTRTMDMNESPISKMFWGKIRSVVKRTGSRDSATLEPFRSLHLDISEPSIHSVEDALLQLTAIEELEVSTSTSSNAIMTMTKQNLLQDLPPMLVLHIKRFHYDPEMGTQKLRRRITYGPYLRIQPNMVASSRRDKLPNYLLVGVVYHHGMYTAGGHYTCDVRRQDGQWIRINDTLIEPISETDVCVTTTTTTTTTNTNTKNTNAQTSLLSTDNNTHTSSHGDWDGWSRTTEGDAYLLFYMDASLYSSTTSTTTGRAKMNQHQSYSNATTASSTSTASQSTATSRKRPNTSTTTTTANIAGVTTVNLHGSASPTLNTSSTTTTTTTHQHTRHRK